jgi:mono/diheme cytochrome c family protein
MLSRFQSVLRRNRVKSTTRRRSPLILLALLLGWSAILGLGLAQAQAPNSIAPVGTTAPVSTAAPIGTVDEVPERYRLGQELYLENCATCHVGLPPAVMPAQTWAQLLPDPQHYGVQITPLTEPSLEFVWSYVSTYSRPTLPGEPTPYRLRQSRYFKALHPKVELPQPASIQSCVTCHPAAAQFNYRSLTPEWQDAP